MSKLSAVCRSYSGSLDALDKFYKHWHPLVYGISLKWLRLLCRMENENHFFKKGMGGHLPRPLAQKQPECNQGNHMLMQFPFNNLHQDSNLQAPEL